MKKQKSKLRGSLASTRTSKEITFRCDLAALAKILSEPNQVPERLNLTKATEISLLARHYLALRKI